MITKALWCLAGVVLVAAFLVLLVVGVGVELTSELARVLRVVVGAGLDATTTRFSRAKWWRFP